MNGKKFIVSALAASSLNSFAGDINALQNAALEEVYQKSGRRYVCEYTRMGWLTGAEKSKTTIDLNLDSKTFVAVTRDTDGEIISKKTYQIVVWNKEGTDNLSISYKSASTETPEVFLCNFDSGTKEMAIDLSKIDVQNLLVNIKCK